MNNLQHAHSPYLRQHAHNPVDWHEWNEKSLNISQTLQKPILLSIGYASCHWCHVMERESFENVEVADAMNMTFVCIKVDREERPDIDAIYMEALQSMGQQGGWPLTVFLMPDTKPFYAGTYFPKEDFLQLIDRIGVLFRTQKEDLAKSAEEFFTILKISDTEKFHLQSKPQKRLFLPIELDQIFENFTSSIDLQYGGRAKAPKFPMPCLWHWVLHYANNTQNENSKKFAFDNLHFTLEKMALGGIYDQVGGGFSRYSVDERWHVPHFEKMLYDNAQLLTLYAQAYIQSTDKKIDFLPTSLKNLYKKIIHQTLNFTILELGHKVGEKTNGFYSGIDADSEGEEGNFYVFTEKEIKNIFEIKLRQNFLKKPNSGTESYISEEINKEIALITQFFGVEKNGNWEHFKNVLFCKEKDEIFAKKYDIYWDNFLEKYNFWQTELQHYRNTRPRPATDTKILTSWNAMMLLGMVNAYKALGEKTILTEIRLLADFVETQCYKNNQLYRQVNRPELGFLEDYAHVIQAFMGVYEVFFEEKYLFFAEKLLTYAQENFWDTEENLYYFTDKNAPALLVRKKEVLDNVIPSSNAVMAKNLYLLGTLFCNNAYQMQAKNMVLQVQKLIAQNIEYMSEWGQVLLLMQKPTLEVVIIGENYQHFAQEIQKIYYPNKILLASEKGTEKFELFINRENSPENNPKNLTYVYICQDKMCLMPITDLEEALQYLREH